MLALSGTVRFLLKSIDNTAVSGQTREVNHSQEVLKNVMSPILKEHGYNLYEQQSIRELSGMRTQCGCLSKASITLSTSLISLSG